MYLGWLSERLEKLSKDFVLGHFSAYKFWMVFCGVNSAKVWDCDFSGVICFWGYIEEFYSSILFISHPSWLDSCSIYKESLLKILKINPSLLFLHQKSPDPLSNFWNAVSTKFFLHCLIGCLSVQSMSSKSTKPDPFLSKIVNSSATSSFVSSQPNSLNPFPNSWKKKTLLA